MDVRNSGSNVIFLRLAFKTIYGDFDYICSTMNAIAVLPNEGWKRISFSIQESNIVAVSSLWDYQVTFGNHGVDEMRILHSETPSWEASSVVATLDIDNIMAENQSLSTNDFQVIEEVVIYPNPADDMIRIARSLATGEKFFYQVIDYTGRVITKGESAFETAISVENLASGNYIIDIQTDSGQVLTRKFNKR